MSYFEKFEGESHSLDSATPYLADGTAGELDLTDARVHLLYLKSDYNGVVKLSKQLSIESTHQPWTCYRIGQSYQNLGMLPEAEAWYRRGVALAPSNLDFKNKLGALLISMDRVAAGVEQLMASLQLNPKQAAALTDLGFATLKSGDVVRAMAYYNQALRLDPDFEQALLNKAGLYNFMGKKAEAKAVLKQILKRNPKNTQVQQLLQQLS